MTREDDGDDEAGGSGPPLPPDDRLWRHPSELGQRSTTGAPPLVAAAPPRSGVWPLVVAAGVIGAALSTAAIALSGTLGPRVVERAVVEKVAVTPVVSSPMLRGERGVVAVAQRLSPAIVRLDVTGTGGSSASGSGVLYRDDGLVLTSAHVVATATSVTVELSDGRRLDGRVLGLDALTDVAVVEVDGDGLPVAVLGTAGAVEVGAPTIAIGSPLGLAGGPSVTTGVISAVGRQVEDEGGHTLHGMLQTDAPIAPGSSGGALVDASGAVIGITTAVAAEPGGRFGFATPIDLVRRVAEQIVRHGRMVHAWLGVEGTDVTAEAAHDMGVAGGAVIRVVSPDSPAERAGLRAHDVVTEVDHHPVRSISALVVAMREHSPGDQVVIGCWRDGDHHEHTITLAERP